MKSLSNEQRRTILVMLENGKSVWHIANYLGVGKSTVSSLRSQLSSTAKQAVTGRPRKITPQDIRRLVRFVTTAKVDNACQLKQLTGLDVTPQTIRNSLKREGMEAIVKAKKPLLKKRHLKARLTFAHKYKDWTEEDWGRVIWSDETKINRFGSDGRVWVWKKKGEPRTKRHIQPTVKHGGGSVMVWGCFTRQGVGRMCKIEGTMDGKVYAAILDNNLPQTAKDLMMRHTGFIFQQDNDSKHCSQIAREWCEDHNIELLDWPAQSPDLNPIEHLWSHLKRQLNEDKFKPTSMHELKRRIDEEWGKITPEVCRKLVDSMPRRIAEVIKAKGGHTSY
jgi:transposase